MQTKESFPVHREFLKLFLPAGILFLALGIILGLSQREASRERIALQQRGDLNALVRGLESEIRVQMADTAFLAEMVEVELPDFADRTEGLRTLSEEFLVFAHTKGAYDQVRFLNDKGMEIIRVQSGPEGFEIAPPEQLQDKSGHGYFTEAMSMEQEVYVSRFDLNMELGRIERPLKPVLRFSAPVSGREGAPPGVIVLNFLGRHLLDEVRRAPTESGARFFLVNPLGEFLVGPTPKDEWAMLLGDKTGRSFPDLYPAEWLHIQQAGNDQFLSSQGMMAYKPLHPFARQGEEGPYWSKGKAKEFWTLISLVEEARLSPSWWRPAIVVWVGLFLLLGMIFWLIAGAKARKTKALRDLAESEKKIRTVTDVAQDGIIMIDSKGCVVLWNPATETIFGYSEEEVLGRDVHDLLVVDEKTREGIEQSMKQLARTGQGGALNHLNEVTTKRKTGETFHAELSIAAFKSGGEWRAVATVRDITQRKKAEEELRRLATTDSLTGLFNRRRFIEVAEREFSRAKRYGDALSMIMLDADKFKAVNDTYGHDVGDFVLKSLASVGRSMLRDIDAFGRVGGEEFMVLLPSTPREGAVLAAEKLRAAIAGTVASTGKGDIHFTVSLGVTSLRKDTENVDMMFKEADEALYLAKNNGRNRVEIFNKQDEGEE